MDARKQEFVVYYSPGTFVAEVSERTIERRDVVQAVRWADGITERHGAQPFAFEFVTRIVANPVPDGEGGVLHVESKEVDRSVRYFIAGYVLTYEDVVALDKHEIAARNMRNNGYPLVVVTDEMGGHRWRSMQPFVLETVIVDRKGAVTDRGDDPRWVAYRDTARATWAAEDRRSSHES